MKRDHRRIELLSLGEKCLGPLEELRRITFALADRSQDASGLLRVLKGLLMHVRGGGRRALQVDGPHGHLLTTNQVDGPALLGRVPRHSLAAPPVQVVAAERVQLDVHAHLDRNLPAVGRVGSVVGLHFRTAFGDELTGWGEQRRSARSGALCWRQRAVG